MSVYPWLTSTGTDSDWLVMPDGKNSRLGELLHERTLEKISAGTFSDHDVAYIRALTIGAAKTDISLTPEQLEKLRQACQLWDIALHPKQIESHRPFIGKIIVKVKQLLFRLLQVLLKDLIRQQRAFNAAVISSLISFAESRPEEQGAEER